MKIELSSQARPLNQYPLYWAECFGSAPMLPMSRAEMDQLGWDSCDVIVVTGDAYVDHPSFAMALLGRLLEAEGYRVFQSPTNSLLLGIRLMATDADARLAQLEKLEVYPYAEKDSPRPRGYLRPEG